MQILKMMLLILLTLPYYAHGGAATPAKPSLSLTPKAIKNFHFSWNDVQGETHYKLLEKPDNNSNFTEIVKLTADTTGFTQTVPLHKRVNAQYILEACNDAGCTPSAAVSALDNWKDAIGYIKASNGEKYDSFGNSIALSDDGNTLAVAATIKASSRVGISGVYVFIYRNNHWIEQAYIQYLIGKADDAFGRSIALSDDGNTLAVSAQAEDSNATGVNGDDSDNSANAAGAVFVYTRTDGAWSKQAYIKAPNTDEKDYFGGVIALAADGNTLAVAAKWEDSSANGINSNQPNNSSQNSGAAYVYTRRQGTWSEQAYIKASNTEESDWFGSSLALSADGRTMAVGAVLEDSGSKGINGDEADNSASSAGAVYVYARSDGAWSQQAYIKASNAGAGDLFGSSTTLSGDGNTLVVGAIGEDSNTTGINGDEADNSASGAGAVYAYTRNDNAWSQQAYIKALTTDTKDIFGYVITLSFDSSTLAILSSGSRITVGGDYKDGSGAASLFTRKGNTWLPQAYIDTPKGIGNAVALSVDGNTLAVGTTKESKNAIGDKKAVYLY